MTIHDRFMRALTRVATASSVARQRSVEAHRLEVRGDDAAIHERLEGVVSRFEALADEMEAALS